MYLRDFLPGRLIRRLSRAAALSLVLLGLAWLPQIGRAQLPAYPQSPQSPQVPRPSKTFMNKQVISLPIQIDPRKQAEFREVQLCVKDHPSNPWRVADRALPSQKEFIFRASKDGEYWFTVVTVDKFGRKSTNDLSTQAPQAIVVIDQLAPQIDVRRLPRSPLGQRFRCTAEDVHLDLAAMRFEYQTGDLNWQELQCDAAEANVFCIPRQAVVTGQIRVTARDRSGNENQKQMHLQDCPTQVHVAKSASSGFPNHTVKLPRLPDQGVIKAHHQPKGKGIQIKQANKPGALLPLPNPPTALELKPVSDLPKMKNVAHKKQLAMAPSNSRQQTGHRTVSRPRLVLNYGIEKQGEGGISKVEIWITSDRGKSWQRLAEDPDKASPAVVMLPGEGTYGLRLVVSNAYGFGGEPPAPGESPDWTVEVDTVAPLVKLLPATTVKGSQPGQVLIRWVASDKNLEDQPISLSYATSPTGPWNPIAKNVENVGQFSWFVPQQARSGVYFQATVTDRGGNTATARSEQPTRVDDMSRPVGRIRDIRQAPSEQSLPNGQ